VQPSHGTDLCSRLSQTHFFSYTTHTVFISSFQSGPAIPFTPSTKLFRADPSALRGGGELAGVKSSQPRVPISQHSTHQAPPGPPPVAHQRDHRAQAAFSYCRLANLYVRCITSTYRNLVTVCAAGHRTLIPIEYTGAPPTPSSFLCEPSFGLCSLVHNTPLWQTACFVGTTAPCRA
jgi:hypothetical protein